MWHVDSAIFTEVATIYVVTRLVPASSPLVDKQVLNSQFDHFV